MKINHFKFIVTLLAITALSFSLLSAQTSEIKKAYLGMPMSDFQLNTLDGKTVKLSELKGKNVLLLFPRIFYATDGDCSICGYQYAELADYAIKNKLKEKYNLEILVVFPFSADVTKKWMSRIPAMLDAVESWKNPKEEELKNEAVKRWMEISKKMFPNKYAFTTENLPMPFPILIDEKRELSKGLDIFREEWSGGKGDQNIPSVFILDKDGVVVFKLIGQHTVDRPNAEYLDKIMSTFLKK